MKSAHAADKAHVSNLTRLIWFETASGPAISKRRYDGRGAEHVHLVEATAESESVFSSSTAAAATHCSASKSGFVSCRVSAFQYANGANWCALRSAARYPLRYLGPEVEPVIEPVSKHRARRAPARRSKQSQSLFSQSSVQLHAYTAQCIPPWAELGFKHWLGFEINWIILLIWYCLKFKKQRKFQQTEIRGPFGK